jgi:hypothetical protein
MQSGVVGQATGFELFRKSQGAPGKVRRLNGNRQTRHADRTDDTPCMMAADPKGLAPLRKRKAGCAGEFRSRHTLDAPIGLDGEKPQGRKAGSMREPANVEAGSSGIGISRSARRD